MRRRIAVTVVAISVLMVIVGLACEARGRSGQARQPAQPRPVHCTIFADAPRPDADPARTMVARARFRCESPGAEVLTVHVRLERKAGIGWRSVRAQPYTMRGTQNHAPIFKYHTRQVVARCATGRYRTVVDWTRTSRGDTSSGTARSVEVNDPCTLRPAT